MSNYSYSLEDWLTILYQRNGSDLHLSSGALPYMRLHGDIIPIGNEKLDQDYLQKILFEILSPSQREKFLQKGDLDFGYEIPNLARFRCNYFMDRKGICGVFRIIPAQIKTIDELGLPEVLKKLALIPKGMVLITGPTGSGKSTTLAAMIDYINKNKKAHIITIEDPIEFVYENENCLINQREIGVHTETFSSALRYALREDPDIILVGEMRDLETIRLAIEAAATGHVVFSTLHTIGAAKTVNRIIEVFPSEEQNHIRATLADVIQGVVSQVLLKRADGKGRIAALEIMIANTGIKNLIRENKTHQILMMMEAGKKEGMRILDDVLIELVQTGQVKLEDCISLIGDKQKLKFFKDIQSSSEKSFSKFSFHSFSS